MAARPPLAPGAEAFDAYFKRADLDQDGRISGAEAVAFFQGSNLSNQTLAQIWNYANQNGTGFLGRPEFYNALKLVTVAQSGRQLTPDIVKAALYGPAAAKIPAPQISPVTNPASQINSMVTPAPQVNPRMPTSAQMGVIRPASSQSFGVRSSQTLPSAGVTLQQFAAQDVNAIRPPQASNAMALPVQGLGQGLAGATTMGGPRPPISSTTNISTDWIGGRTTGSLGTVNPQVPVRGISPSVSQDGLGLVPSGTVSGGTPVIASKPQSPDFPMQQTTRDSKALVASGNGFPSDSLFGGDVFSATPQTKQDTSVPTFPASNISGSSTISGSQIFATPEQFNSLQSTSSLTPGISPSPSAQSSTKQNQIATTSNNIGSTIMNVSAVPASSVPFQSQGPWPKITQTDIQKYTAVFLKVDKDNDGKITGKEARDLFLSWRLPREILRQVWDLSDQDNDSMLSLREFCTALYLMERYREGRPLPILLPNELRFDETLLHAATAYSGSTWQPAPGLTPLQMSAPRSVVPITGMTPPMQTQASQGSQTDGAVEPVRPKSKVPVLEAHLINQLSKEEQSGLNSKLQEAVDADKKVQELEKEILDAKEKIEFYRTKMQELVLYKSRCDSRLNEITERASADKHEVESLAKKYEEKCRQLGDVASKLTIEEATFHAIQERKLEIYNQIVKLEQLKDGQHQDHAIAIQSDLEELVKSLNDRCKQYGLRAKPTSVLELPFGWQPGIQQAAADWDEDWDKLEDEEFTIIKELTIEVEKVVTPAKPKSTIVSNDTKSVDEASTSALSSNVNNNTEKASTTDKQRAESEPPSAHSGAELARSPPASPAKNVLESHPEEYNSAHLEVNDASPRAKETQSDHAGAEPTIFDDKFADEQPWITSFDNDDTDSVWVFNAIRTKEADQERNSLNSFFGFGDFSINTVKVDSPSAASVFGKDKGPFFDSVPSTPLFRSNSPRFNDGAEDYSFDSFSKFDSFSMHDSGPFPPREATLTRLDSMQSTADSGFFPPRDSFTRFDSFRSTADSGMFPQRDLARFDSIRSTADHTQGFASFDDNDPFGSTGPFKASESHSPRRISDSWSSF